jgi:CRP-like cAMP-binding protein
VPTELTTELAIETHPIDSKLRRHQTIEVWPSGRALFFEDEEPRGVYVIYSGRVDLVFSSRDGRTKTLRAAGPGRILGLSAVFSHKPHHYTATVGATSTLGFVDAATFHRLLESKPSMLLDVLRLLSEDVNSCYDCMREIALAR